MKRLKYINYLFIAGGLALGWSLSSVSAQALDIPFISEKDAAYTVEFTGVDDDAELKEWLIKVSSLKPEDAALPLSFQLLQKQADDDLPELLQALHARGYYAALISNKVAQDAETEEILVTYHVIPGAIYTVRSEQIDLLPTAPTDLNLPDLRDIKPSIDQPARAAKLNAGAAKVEDYIASHNCLVFVRVTAAVMLEPAVQAAHVYYEVASGPRADFGEVAITGDEDVKLSAIRRMLPFEQGECFRADKVEEAETELLQSGLFSTVEIKHEENPGQDGQLPLVVEVTERKHRTVKGGVSYMTDEGPGVSAGWEHRNFLGGGETFAATGVLSALQYSAEANFNEPYFYASNQSLKLGARLAREEVDAYSSDSLSITGLVERRLSKRWRIGGGGGYRLSQVDEPAIGQERFGLFYLPFYTGYDSRDDVLNATKGIHARLDGAPYYDTLGSGAQFFRTLATGSTYFALPGVYDPIIALRGAFGSLAGASTRDIPADIRFYAGGGSSVRGYGYQELSPRRNGVLVGGKSLLETSAELRLKATETIGGVIFLDGGNAFEAEYPEFGDSLRWGAGIGGRYYTDFGPVRLDIAIPLDKRKEDDAFQIYVSLGQAF